MNFQTQVSKYNALKNISLKIRLRLESKGMKIRNSSILVARDILLELTNGQTVSKKLYRKHTNKKKTLESK